MLKLQKGITFTIYRSICLDYMNLWKSNILKKRRAHNGRELSNFSANFFNYLSYIVDGFLGYKTGLHYC